MKVKLREVHQLALDNATSDIGRTQTPSDPTPNPCTWLKNVHRLLLPRVQGACPTSGAPATLYLSDHNLEGQTLSSLKRVQIARHVGAISEQAASPHARPTAVLRLLSGIPSPYLNIIQVEVLRLFSSSTRPASQTSINPSIHLLNVYYVPGTAFISKELAV